ncbi:MAG TPA: hypothetical protein VH879_13060 [Gemmatimonadales bacterium]|jgi:hypothetical protein
MAVAVADRQIWRREDLAGFETELYGTTVTRIDARTASAPSPTVRVITALPGRTPVTPPVASIAAIAGESDSHRTAAAEPVPQEHDPTQEPELTWI